MDKLCRKAGNLRYMDSISVTVEKSVVKPDLSPLLREQKIHIIKLEH